MKATHGSKSVGTGEGNEAYSEDDVMRYLRWDKPPAEQLKILPYAGPYVMGSEDLRRMAFHSIVTYDNITPEAFTAKPASGPVEPKPVIWQ